MCLFTVQTAKNNFRRFSVLSVATQVVATVPVDALNYMLSSANKDAHMNGYALRRTSDTCVFVYVLMYTCTC